MLKTVFVTGISGFLASHIVEHLVEGGHRVIGTARAKKVDALRKLYKEYPAVEVIEVNDIANDTFIDKMKDVDVVIHTATPMPGNDSFEIIVEAAVKGATNVLAQVEKAGVKKVVVTSSFITVVNDPRQDGPAFRNDDWNRLTKEEATPKDGQVGFAAYAYAKVASEKAVWEWAKEHPHVEVTTINPPFLFGPFSKFFPSPAPGDLQSLSTNLMVYNLISEKGAYPSLAVYLDIRDTAQAHIGAAFRKASAGKRVLIASPHPLALQPLLDTLKAKRPSIEGRLIKGPVPQYPYDKLTLDTDFYEVATGMQHSDFHTSDETILDTIDSLLALEAEWKDQGFTVDVIPPHNL